MEIQKSEYLENEKNSLDEIKNIFCNNYRLSFGKKMKISGLKNCFKKREHVMMQLYKSFPVKIYLFKVNNKNTRKWSEICSKLAMKTPQNVIEVALVSLLLTLNIFYRYMLFSDILR